MAEIICITHRGIRCGIPSRQILGADPIVAAMALMELWDGPRAASAPGSAEERALRVLTPEGPRWICGEHVVLSLVPRRHIHPLPPVLRDFVCLPHLVGLAEVEGSLTWLVDTTRFRKKNGVDH